MLYDLWIFRCLCAEQMPIRKSINPSSSQHIPISGVSCRCFQTWRWMTTVALAICPRRHLNGFSADAQGAALKSGWVVSSMGSSTVEGSGVSQVGALLAGSFSRITRFFIVGHLHGKALGQLKCSLQSREIHYPAVYFKHQALIRG